MSQSSWNTSVALVMSIVETDPNVVGTNGAGLSPFIDTANAMVRKVCQPNPDCDATSPRQLPLYDLEQLELIERYLAAHFYSIRDLNLQVVAESAGDVSQTFLNFGPGKGFASTRYGQQAMALDYQGNLAALQKRLDDGVAPRPGIRSLGRRRRGFGIR